MVYNHTFTTNVGKEFLALLDKCFPPGNLLRKIFNRNNVKVSYSTTPNMAQIILGVNGKLLAPREENEKTCSCPKNKKMDCPLDQKCLSKNIVYQATVSVPNKEPSTYIGQTSVTFKARLAVHKQTFKDQNTSQTALRGRSFMTSTALGGGGGVNQILTFADGGEGCCC